MNADGTNPVPLTTSDTAGTYNENASWSPDSTKVAFTRSSGSGTCFDEVWVIDVATHVETQLTSCVSDVSSEHPAWSPDGTKITFANASSSDSIWIMSADGSTPTIVPQGGLIDNGQPEWQPIVSAPRPAPAPAPAAAPEVVVITPRFTG